MRRAATSKHSLRADSRQHGRAGGQFFCPNRFDVRCGFAAPFSLRHRLQPERRGGPLIKSGVTVFGRPARAPGNEI